MHRLQAVAHIGQRARDDDAHRIVEVARLHFVDDVDRRDAVFGRVGGGISSVKTRPFFCCSGGGFLADGRRRKARGCAVRGSSGVSGISAPSQAKIRPVFGGCSASIAAANEPRGRRVAAWTAFRRDTALEWRRQSRCRPCRDAARRRAPAGLRRASVRWRAVDELVERGFRGAIAVPAARAVVADAADARRQHGEHGALAARQQRGRKCLADQRRTDRVDREASRQLSGIELAHRSFGALTIIVQHAGGNENAAQIAGQVGQRSENIALDRGVYTRWRGSRW